MAGASLLGMKVWSWSSFSTNILAWWSLLHEVWGTRERPPPNHNQLAQLVHMDAGAAVSRHGSNSVLIHVSLSSPVWREIGSSYRERGPSSPQQQLDAVCSFPQLQIQCHETSAEMPAWVAASLWDLRFTFTRPSSNSTCNNSSIFPSSPLL